MTLRNKSSLSMEKLGEMTLGEMTYMMTAKRMGEMTYGYIIIVKCMINEVVMMTQNIRQSSVT